MTNAFKYLLIALIIILFACDKPQGPGSNIANFIYITVLNEDGEDLLNPLSSENLDLSKVKVFYLLGGVKTEIKRSNLDYPQMFSIEEPNITSDKYKILLFLNTEDRSNTTTTYFEWGPMRTDVFRSLLNRSQGSIHNEKIWLNDELICDVNVNPVFCDITIIIENQ